MGETVEIDVRQLQARIGQRAVYRFAQDFERAATGRHGNAAQTGADDGGGATQGEVVLMVWRPRG